MMASWHEEYQPAHGQLPPAPAAAASKMLLLAIIVVVYLGVLPVEIARGVL